jgi:uncharacterized protein YggE
MMAPTSAWAHHAQQRFDPRRRRPMVSPSGKRGLMVVAALVMASALMAGVPTAAEAASPARPNCSTGAPTVTVSATGQASATPNVLTIEMGVQVTDPTASAALSDANDRATTLTNTLKLLGVTAGDIQSTNFSISPTLAQDGTITGYSVSNQLVVTLHTLSNAGQVIDAAASSVGNAIRIQGLSFSVSNTRNVDGQARSHAVSAAAANAHAMASTADESVVGVCSINDTTTQTVFGAQGDLAGGANSPVVAVPLEPGTQQATAQVRVVYAITHQ